MASGFYTGHQHQLLDMKDFNKEKFIEFCDKQFYHLERFGYTSLQDRGNKKEDEIKRYQGEVDSYTNKLAEFQSLSDEELTTRYEKYVTHTLSENERRLKIFQEEKARLKVIHEYAQAIKPHLDYIWKDLKEPTLHTDEILDKEEWAGIQIKSFESSLKFYTRLRDQEGNSRPSDEYQQMKESNERAIASYEQKKKEFLEGL